MCANSYKNISITEKDILEYFQRVEESDRIPIGRFHIVFKDILLEKLNVREYQLNFPRACKILYAAYFTESNLDAFLFFVNENGYIPKNFDIKFFDGRSVLRYWRSNKTEIFKILFEDLDKEGFQLKYPIAYAIIKDRYKTYQERLNIIKFNKLQEEKEKEVPCEKVDEQTELLLQKSAKENLYCPSRVLDFIELVDKFGAIPTSKYYKRNKKYIMKIFEEEHYRLLYPKAYEVLSNYSEQRVLLFEEKVIELLNCIEKIERNITQKECIKFSNGDDMYGFWCAKRLDIIEYFMTNFDKNDYPNFYQVVMHYKATRLLKNDSLIYCFIGYVDSYHRICDMPLTGKQTISDYWEKNKDVLYYMALNNYFEEFPIAKEIIISKYENIINEEYKKL